MFAMVSRNHVALRPLSRIKQSFVPATRSPRKVVGGIYKGLVLDLDLQHETQVFLGLYERETFPCIRAAAARARWMIDVGAGNGELALFFLRQPGIGLVHAFEPLPKAVATFRRNLALNDLQDDPRLAIHAGFAGAQPGFTRLDDLAVDRSAPGFLKIDVDGFELDVLASAERLLAAAHPDVLLEVHSAPLEADGLAQLRRFGYAPQIVDNAWWRVVIPERRPIPHNRWLWAPGPR